MQKQEMRQSKTPGTSDPHRERAEICSALDGSNGTGGQTNVRSGSKAETSNGEIQNKQGPRVTIKDGQKLEVKFTVPLTPPSVNEYKVPLWSKRRFYVTKEATAFKEAIAIFGRGRSLIAESYFVSLQVFLGKNKRGDADNFAKCCLDGIAEAGIILGGDSRISKLTIEKFRDWQNPRTEFTIEAHP